MTEDRDERLSRLLDGAFSGDGMDRLDSADLARLKAFARADGAIRDAFSAAPAGPDHAAAIRSGFARRRSGAWRRWIVPTVAAAAAVLVAVVGMEQRIDSRVDAVVAELRAEREADLRMVAAAMQQVLETEASGTPVRIANHQTGMAMTLVPQRTWRSESGHWCRAFAEIPEGAQPDEAPVTTACRDETGQWRRVTTEFHAPLTPLWETEPGTQL